MYLHIQKDVKCSNCGAMNKYETVTRWVSIQNSETIIRCLGCGHEKITKTTTTCDTSDAHLFYKAEDYNKPELF